MDGELAMGDYRQMQSDLEERYKKFHASANFYPSLAQRLSPPLLISVFDKWIESRYKIVVIGQETAGWDFKRNDVNYPYYSWNYDFDICKFIDFKSIGAESAIKAMVHGYREFDFSRHQPTNYNGPFWTAYRQLRRNLENDLNRSILWTNVFRMDVDNNSVIKNATDQERQSIYEITSGLLSDELSILNPKVVIFFTGPDYDEAIKRQFPNVHFNGFAQHELRKVARLIHPSLPECTIRTYHPKYLRLSRQWEILTDIEIFIKSNLK